MEQMLPTAAVHYGAEVHDVADLVLVGWLTGGWTPFENEVARGLALDDAHGGEVPADELDAALEEFRRERKLLAAADVGTWLAERALRLDDVRAVLRRRALRERDAHAGTVGDHAIPPTYVIWSEAVCSGTLASYATTLLRWHAAFDRVGAVEDPADSVVGLPPTCLASRGNSELRRRLVRLTGLRASWWVFASTMVTDEDVHAYVAANRFDWTVVRGDALSFGHEGAGREARLRLVHDREPLERVAATLGLATRRCELALGDLPGALAAELLAADVGDVVGPWPADGDWHVLAVDGRVEADAASCHRARPQLVAERLDRLAAGTGSVVGHL